MKRTPLIARAPVDRSDEPGYRAWKAPAIGACEACGARGLLLRHHVLTEAKVRAAGGDPWDPRNAMRLGYYACSCHREHHHASRRLLLGSVPAAAIAFTQELLGAEQASEYLRRYYAA